MVPGQPPDVAVYHHKQVQRRGRRSFTPPAVQGPDDGGVSLRRRKARVRRTIGSVQDDMARMREPVRPVPVTLSPSLVILSGAKHLRSRDEMTASSGTASLLPRERDGVPDRR